MRVLVTGAAGFIGSTTAELLLLRGHDVVALDNLSKGRIENVPSGATFVEGDCGDESLVLTLGSFDACIHFAGRIEPAESVTHPEEFFANNVGSTFALTRSLVSLGVERFVFSSSAAVYGNQVEMPITEDRRTSPESPYGHSKRMVEEALHWLAELGKMRAASLRYFNAAGGTLAHPERHTPEIHLIPLALDVVLDVRGHLDLYGDDYATPDGTCVRDYVHVLDLAEAHILAIEALADHRELVVNLGSGIGYSNRQVLDAVKRTTGVDFDVRVAPRRPGDPASAVADIAIARSVLGWQPGHSALDTIVADAWEARQLLYTEKN
jgi:UDP-glucose 4-epimerase